MHSSSGTVPLPNRYLIVATLAYKNQVWRSHSTRRRVLSVSRLALDSACRTLGGQTPDRTEGIRRAIESGSARNVLLFIGDGMGDSEITLARNYTVGAGGHLAMDRLPFTGEYTTYAMREDLPSVPNYVTDSAASGTGWATGTKTSNGYQRQRARTSISKRSSRSRRNGAIALAMSRPRS